MDSNRTFVVVGGGQAGGWAARTLRDEGFEGRIILIGEEDFPPHERPPLSKDVLIGDAERETCLLWPETVLQEANVELRLGQRVTSLDPANHSLTLDSGETLPWARLLLATGGRARTLTVPGCNLDGVYTLRTVSDSEDIRSSLVEGARVVVVGAGWIGLEVAAAARKRGADVVVLEVAERVCARALTDSMSDWVFALHQRHGVDIRLGVGLAGFEGADRVERVVLNDDSTIDCDVSVIGVGIEPNVELAVEAGLDVDDGIIVDAFGRTSHPDIFAAGDVTSHPNALLGRRIRLESWENAQNQAINSARSMLGKEDPYAEIPWFWSDQYDANIQLMGLPAVWDQVAVRGSRDDGHFIEFYLDGERLVGAAAVNNPRDLRFTRRMMMADKTYQASDLENPEIKLQALLRR